MKRIYRATRMARKIEMATKEELIQLAMLIDSDGSIDSTDGIHPHIKVGMSSELPYLIYLIWGGSIFKSKQGDKWHYEWEINKREDVMDYSLALESYLLLKIPQARTAVKMVNILRKKPQGWKEKCKELAQELSVLNHALPPDIDVQKPKERKTKS